MLNSLLSVQHASLSRKNIPLKKYRFAAQKLVREVDSCAAIKFHSEKFFLCDSLRVQASPANISWSHTKLIRELVILFPAWKVDASPLEYIVPRSTPISLWRRWRVAKGWLSYMLCCIKSWEKMLRRSRLMLGKTTRSCTKNVLMAKFFFITHTIGPARSNILWYNWFYKPIHVWESVHIYTKDMQHILQYLPFFYQHFKTW